jgi:hypothetical protein
MLPGTGNLFTENVSKSDSWAKNSPDKSRGFYFVSGFGVNKNSTVSSAAVLEASIPLCGSDTFSSIKIFDCARHKLAVKYMKKLFAGCQTQLPGCQFIVRGTVAAPLSIQFKSRRELIKLQIEPCACRISSQRRSM